MTIGIEEAVRRNQMSWNCSFRNRVHHAKCTGYYISRIRDKEGFRELDLCQCECHGTRKKANAPPRRLKDHLQSNPGVSGEGDSS